MALARQVTTVAPAAAAQPSRPAPFSPADLVVADPASIVVPANHIRRCTWRRVTALPRSRRELQMYDVDCLHPGLDAVVPLGNLDSARQSCADCTLPGVFRPDED
ncbi:MAG TPA: hypothetical protein VNT28_09465 [Candidatus Limnocylindrales bacterium]|jgi:hypothetical protein|nr:hypothetical protein [Candidatus Limnocylindrales bacterium]